MRVLFYTTADFDNLECKLKTDYQLDSLFYGFRSILGDNVIDYPKFDHMYKEAFPELQKKCTHRGFTLYNRLEDIEVDRTDIQSKIRNNYFDFIIFGLHHSNYPNLKLICQKLYDLIGQQSKTPTVFVDGHDSHLIHMVLFEAGLYFKRELCFSTVKGQLYPISFSVPEHNIINYIPDKDQDFAKIIPSYLFRGHPHAQTYIYDNEEDYYNDYKRSFYSFNSSKAGYDTLRLLEIISCRSMPFFSDIEGCSFNTLFNHPKDLYIKAKQLPGLNLLVHNKYNFPQNGFLGTIMDNFATTGHFINHSFFPKDKYYTLLDELLKYARKYLTNEWMAKYIIGVVKEVYS